MNEQDDTVTIEVPAAKPVRTDAPDALTVDHEATNKLFGFGEPQAKPAETTNPPSWIQGFRNSDRWLWMEIVGGGMALVALIPTALMMGIDYEDRKRQRAAQAWELVTREAPGNSGKGPALEYLNKQSIPLMGVRLKGSYLEKVVLPEAELTHANLAEANLTDADLNKAVLNNADLTRAILRNANLTGAILWRADLPEADLSEANLSGANLSGANLSRAKSLRQAQLDGACGSEKTQLPSGLSVKSCAFFYKLD